MPLRICRQRTVSNLPFKPLVRFYTSSDGERLSPHPFNILSLLFYFVLAKRQCAAPNSSALCRFKFAFQTVCISPTACVRRAAFAAPFRHCAGSNSPFKPLVRFRTSSDGGRLSPHPFNILSLLFAYIMKVCYHLPLHYLSWFPCQRELDCDKRSRYPYLYVQRLFQR